MVAAKPKPKQAAKRLSRPKASAKKSAATAGAQAKKRPASVQKDSLPELVLAPEPSAEAKAWSYDRLWDPPEIRKGWHSRNVTFWREEASDVRGMTGGGVSDKDLPFSQKAMKALAKRYRNSSRFAVALECGAGIGRVTNGVLREHCDHIHLVELVQKHVTEARRRVGQRSDHCTFSFHNSSMQKFRITPRTFDLIWCQWLLMYLTDEDGLDLLTRARKGLKPDGILVVKENQSTINMGTYFDDADGELVGRGGLSGPPVSCVRTPLHHHNLFERAGLRIVEERVQNLGSDNMKMGFFVLMPAS
mmetsp:Transcript_19088/g.44618  ORF Transcript_19088/g.44618 Transcript_19088/m.44618 type:complete len:304 (-) Transcript_19088:81-992(-)